jgi:CheY-like chemotaxis protein
MQAIHPGASTTSEPPLRPNSPDVSRHPALGRGSTVLLVDDNHHHRIPLLRALREQGHNVLYAADGVSGDALCQASQLDIDALVACADMKRMCGFELARRVGRMRPEVRVLLMWRQVQGPEEAQRADENGYAGIAEPFTPEQLCRRLTGLLASPRTIGSIRKHLTPQGDPSMEHGESQDVTDGGSEIVQEASSLVSCFWCERLHPGEHPLAVCPACVARYSAMRALEMSESYSLSDEASTRR